MVAQEVKHAVFQPSLVALHAHSNALPIGHKFGKTINSIEGIFRLVRRQPELNCCSEHVRIALRAGG
jgi:hypothetical protein